MTIGSKVLLITGADRGIGLETVKALLRSDSVYHIVLCSIEFELAESAVVALQAEIQSTSTLTPAQVDIEDDESIIQLYRKVSNQHSKLDILVNNAGAMFDPHILDGRMSARQGWNKSWNVNVVGAQIMTTTFLPLLLKSHDPRLLFVTSGLSSLELSTKFSDPDNMEGVASYRSSKVGLNMMMLEWARNLKDQVKVCAVAPGFVATELGGDVEGWKKMGAGHPSAAGAVVCKVVEGTRDADVGRVVCEYGARFLPW